MTTSSRKQSSSQVSQPAYRILVAGCLDERWTLRTQGMSITPQHTEYEGNCTELVGMLCDDAALMGVLSALYNHGVRILRVERLDEAGSSAAPNCLSH